MAKIPLCLCVILTLWMVSPRPSGSIRPEVSISGAWWGTPGSKKIAQLADAARRKGDLPSAEIYYKQGFDDATRRHDERAIVGYLSGIGACRLSQLRYRATFEALLEAKRHAKFIDDRLALGAIAVNLSSLYLQVWDFEAAEKEADEGRAAVSSLKRPYYLPNLLIQLGRLHEIRRDGMAADLYSRGVETARLIDDKGAEALGLDLLAEERLRAGDLNQAETAIKAGLHLREQFSPKDLGYSWGWMGALGLAKGNLVEAERFTELALASKLKAPEYVLKHQRGAIRRALGDEAGSLLDFREAVQLFSQWRLEVLPPSTMLTAAREQVEWNIFSSFIEAAAREALRTGNPRWAEEAFEAVEFNRAASLRESLALADAWHRKLPVEYWEMLGKLRADIGVLGRTGASAGSSSLNLVLAAMETKAGLAFTAKNSEIFQDQTSLIHFQQGLGSTEVLLSFHLGDRESYVWSVSRKALHLKKIAASGEIHTRVLEFGTAVRAGRPEAVEAGAKLYRELFGGLEQEAATKQSWLLSLEGALFEVPFAALVTERKGGIVKYLVSEHSVQTIPGALLLSKRAEAGTGKFLGVGDPIYNKADSRWSAQPAPPRFLALFRTITSVSADSQNQFSRLVGSAAELKASASNWQGEASILLEGRAAVKSTFLHQLSELKQPPAVVHLATHVVSQGTQTSIALGLGPNAESEFLSTADVASLHVPGALVAMSGCDTGGGEVRAGAGLLGLTRAWEMAGASAVVATSWPVLDSTGDIFSSFYRHLNTVPAAEALRLSQLEMLQSGTWRAAPAYWAAYHITGGTR